MADHDNGYKLLFSHAAMVADLLRGFVKEDWVREVDFDTLRRVDGSYVSDELIDEARIPEMELESERNLAAALFRLETSQGAKDVGNGIVEMAAYLAGSSDESLRRSVETWLKRVLLPTRFPGLHVPEVADLQEIQAMLAERALEWTREWKEEGRQKGLEEGRQEAVHSLQQVVLFHLEQRFGTVAGEVRQNVEKLRDLETLTHLAKQIVIVSSIEELGLG